MAESRARARPTPALCPSHGPSIALRRLDVRLARVRDAAGEIGRFGAGEREIEPVHRQVLGARVDLRAEAERGDLGVVMVPLVGIELTTYRLQGGCSTN